MKFLLCPLAFLSSLALASLSVDVEYVAPGKQVSTVTNTALVFNKEGESLAFMPGVDLKLVKQRKGTAEFELYRYADQKSKEAVISRATLTSKVGEEMKLEEKNEAGELIYSLKIHPRKIAKK